MKITRRLLALLLALCLTFGNVMPAMATELTNEEPAAVENTTQLAEEPESTEGEVSGTVGIEDNPFDEEPTSEPTSEPTAEPTAEPTKPAEVKPTATISFADKANRTAFSDTEQIWKQNGITFTNVKHNYNSKLGDYANPVRLYSGTKSTVEYPGMTKIVFTCGDNSKYYIVSAELSSLGKVSIDGAVVTLELSSPADSIEFVTTAQRRLDSIDIYATGTPVTPPVDPTPSEPAESEPAESEPAESEPVETQPVVPGDVAETATLSFATHDNRTSYSTSQQVWAQNSITFTNDKASSSTNIRNNSGDGHVRLYQDSSVTIEYPAAMNKIIFTVTESNYATPLANSVANLGTTVIDGLTVTLVLANADTSVQFSMTAQSRLSQLEVRTNDTTVPEEPENTDPTPDSVLTVAEALALAESKAAGIYTAGKYYVTGKLVNIANTQYGNLYIADEAGTELYIYGINGWSNMETLPAVGDTITVYGVLGKYQTTPQMKNADITEHIPAGGEPETPSEPTEPETPTEPAEEPEIKTGVAYNFGMIQENVSTTDVYYLTGAMDSYYMATTTDAEASVDVYVEATEGGFYFYAMIDGAKKYINMTVSTSADGKTHVNGAFEDTASTVYTYDNDKDTLIAVVNGEDYWFGTRNDKTFTTVGPVKVSYNGFYCKFYPAEGGEPEATEPQPSEPAPSEPAPSEPQPSEPAEEPEIKTGVAYKFGMIQENVSTTDVYYLTGAMDSYYMATTTDAEASVDVYVEETDGGFYFYAMVNGTKKYINMVVSGTHVNGAFEDAASTVYTYDNDKDTLIAVVNDADYWFGTRNDKQFTTVGPCKVEYDGFYCKFYSAEGGEPEATEPAPTEPTPTEPKPSEPAEEPEIKSGVAYKFGMIQENVSTTDVYYLTGAMDSYYMATTTDAEASVDVYVEETDGGFYFYAMVNGTKKYINMVVSGTHVNGAFEDTASTVYTYDNDKDTLIAVVNGADYWFGTRNDKQFTTVGPCKVEYDGFYCKFYPAEGGEPEATEPAPTEPQPTEPPAPGTEGNPEQIMFQWNEDGTAATAVVVVPANTEYYVTFVTGMMGGDMMLTIDGEPYGIVNGSRFQPVVMALRNGTDVEETHTLVLTYPQGSQMNPDTLKVYVEGVSESEWDGFNQVWLEEGDPDGYLFSWTADADGQLTIEMENGAAGWAYSIINMNTYVMTESHYSCDIPNVNAETIDVKAGDLIQVMVNSCGEDAYTIPGGNVAFTASFVMTPGTASNPIDVDFTWNDEYTAAEVDVTVPANTTYYVRAYGIGGMMLSIDGAEATKLEGNPRMPVIIELVNDTAEEKTFNLCVTQAEGTVDNPAVIELGETVATLEAGSEGYHYKYTATDRGTLTVAVSGNGWTYCVNNITAGIYGDTHWHDDDPVVATETVAVNKGDEIVIMVNTYDPMNPWSAPAGTVTLNLSMISEPQGTIGNPIALESGYNSFELAEGDNSTYYSFKATEAGTLNVSVYDAEYGELMPTFTINGETVEAVELAEGEEAIIHVQCAGPGTVAVELYFEAVPGSVNNPIVSWDPTTETSFTINPEQTAYFSARNVGGSNLHIVAFGSDEMVLTLEGETYSLIEGEELVIAIPDSGMGFYAPPTVFSVTNYSWDYAGEVVYYFGYEPGHMTNPVDMVLGKNTANIEAGTQGFYYNWTATGSGFLELTMNTKTGWNYVINNTTACLYSDTYFSDMTPVPTKGYMAVHEGDEIEVIVNTYDPANPFEAPAGTVAFTAKMIQSYNDKLASGKSMTLKYINPTNGKTVANSSVKWEMFSYQLDEWGDKMMDEETFEYITMPVPAEIATLKAGKLTAAAGLTEPAEIVVKGVYGETENIYNITIYPLPTDIQINATMYGPEGVEQMTGVNGQTLTYDLARGVLALGAVVNPDAALQDVTWTSSNKKILNIVESEDGIVALEPVVDAKNMKVGTGTVTITATAKDGSGVKASVKVNVTCSAIHIEVSSKNGQTVVGSGKSLTMVANVPFAVNKAVTWDVKVVNVPTEDFDHASVATISAKGVLTAKKGLTVPYTVEVSATAKDGSGVVGTTEITIAPVATKVVIDAPATHDLTTGDMIYVTATALSMSGETVLHSSNDVKWTVSNKKIATIVYEEDWDGSQIPVLFLTGKTGKVTLTATATDGSNVKKSVTINVVKSPETLTLSAHDVVLAVGKSLTLKATVGPNNATDKKVIWSAKALTNDPVTGELVELTNDIGLTVKNGKVSLNTKKVQALIKETGNYPVIEVTATANMADPYGEYATDTCMIQLCAATTKVSIIRYGTAVNGKTLTIDDDAVVVLGVDYEPSEAGYYHNWKSSNTKLATVTENWDGTVTVKPVAGKVGTVTITATAADGTGKSASVKIKIVRKVDAIEVDTSSFALSGKTKGNTFDLNKLITISPSNASNKKVTWSISSTSATLAAENKITLSAAGKLTAKKNVEAPVSIYVTAKAADGLGATKTFRVTITPAATGITIKVYDEPVTSIVLLSRLEMLKVTADAEGEFAADVFTWKSSNTKVAKIVVEDGEVYVVGVKAGTAKITATAKDGSGKSATITVKVLPDKA